jgi:hypothetical protein
LLKFGDKKFSLEAQWRKVGPHPSNIRLSGTFGISGSLLLCIIFKLSLDSYEHTFIERFWSMKDFTSALADKVVTSRAVNRFKITARLAQCAAKQAKEMVRSQKERKVKTMPVLRRKVATLDNRFVKWDWRESTVSVYCQTEKWTICP